MVKNAEKYAEEDRRKKVSTFCFFSWENGSSDMCPWSYIFFYPQSIPSPPLLITYEWNAFLILSIFIFSCYQSSQNLFQISQTTLDQGDFSPLLFLLCNCATVSMLPCLVRTFSHLVDWEVVIYTKFLISLRNESKRLIWLKESFMTQKAKWKNSRTNCLLMRWALFYNSSVCFSVWVLI